MTHLEEYHEYLAGPEWAAKRSRALSRGKNRCAACGSTSRLQVHHLTYARIFREDLSDLMVLCRQHHEEVEAWIAGGHISRCGDVKRLAARTIELLRGSSDSSKSAKAKGKNKKKASPVGVSRAKKHTKKSLKPQVSRVTCEGGHHQHVQQQAQIGIDRPHEIGRCVRLTDEVMHTFMTPGGNINRAQMEILGVTFPPTKGWMKRVRNMSVAADTLDRLMAARCYTVSETRIFTGQS